MATTDPSRDRPPSGVRAEGVRFAYEEADGFSLVVSELHVSAGSKVAFIGPSGSGKTTLLHLLAGILVPSAGRIRVGETEVTALDDARRRRFRIGNIGLIFQELELLEHLTVRENALLPYFVHRALTLDAGVEGALERLARSLGVADRLERRPRSLSHGERQRVAVCRALVTEPAVLLADEPTGNLDPENTRAMLDLVFQEVDRRQATFLMVTHDHTLLDDFDRVIDVATFHAGGVA